MRVESLDQRLDPDHPARTVWAYVESLDLTELLDRIRAVEGGVGRNATDPRLPFALWLLATIDGIASGRALAALAESHRAYEWLCGGVTVNYHLLSDFRSQHAEFLNRVYAESIAALTKEGLVDLNVVSQDGMRVRASAGSDSFRRRATLEEHLRQAEEQVRRLEAERTASSAQAPRQSAAQRRGAQEKVERLQEALRQFEELNATQAHQAKKTNRKDVRTREPRASSTDPESRRMKMSDGGTRPAYNAQFATDVESGLVVGVAATNAGNDAHELEPMFEQIRAATGRDPEAMLVDGGYGTRGNVEAAAGQETLLYTPLKAEQRQLAKGQDPYAPKRGDTSAMAAYRGRMGTELAKRLYRLRGESAEWVNARARAQGLMRLTVRGLKKVRAVLVLFALAHNLQTAIRLRDRRKQLAPA
jgi:transposase